MRKKTVLGSLVIFALVLAFACAVAVRVSHAGHEGPASEKAIAVDARSARRSGPAGERDSEGREASARDAGTGSVDATGPGDDGTAPAGGGERSESVQDSGKDLGESGQTWDGQGATMEGPKALEAVPADSRSVGPAGSSEADAGEEVGAPAVGEPSAGGPAEGRDGDVDESTVQPGEEGPEDGDEESVDLSVAGPEDDDQVFELPDGAVYEPEEVLLSVDPGVSAEDVEALLAKVPGIAAQSVDAADVSSGLLCVELEPGASVEDAINAVRAARSSVIRGSQPNYVYYLAGADEDVAAVGVATADVAPDVKSVDAEETDTAEGEAPSAPDGEAQGQSEASIDEEAPGQSEVTPSENDALTDVEEGPLVPSEGEDADDDAPDQFEEADAVEAAPSKGERSVDTLNTDAVVLETHEDSATSSLRNAAGDQSVPNARVTIDDPKADKLWGLESMRAYEAWSLARCEGQVAVAVCDGGFALDHEDLAQNVIAGSAYDAYAAYEGRLDDVNSPLQGGRYYSTHGTHVAGIVAAVANNGTGVAGVSYNARIVPIDCFGDSGYSNSFLLALSYDYIIKNAETYNIKVVNMSLGSDRDSDSFEDDVLLAKVREAHEMGIVTVAAAGNEIAHTDEDGFKVTDATPPFYAGPGDSASVVGVIALKGTASDAGNDASGAYEVCRAEWSNYNVLGQGGADTRKGKNISAPGEEILSTISTINDKKTYHAYSGTSMASPYVAGIVALEFAANPDLTADEAVDILCHSAYDLGAQGWDEEYGFGEADAYEAVRMATAGGVTAGAGEGSEVVLRLVVPEGGYACDGTPREPDVEATLVGPEDGSVSLVRGRDFAVTYANNVDAGWATVTVAGMGDYEGTFRRDLHFTIQEGQGQKRDISSEGIEVKIEGSYTYEARPLCPNVKVTDDGKLLEPAYDYRVLGHENNVDAGEGVVIIEGVGAYEGVRRERFVIARCPIDDKSISGMSISDVARTYTGEPIQPYIEPHRSIPNGARVGGKITYYLDLVEGVDYTATCENNVDAGTATVTLAGIGNYTGTLTQSFAIVPVSIDYAIINNIPDQAYTGKAIKPEPTVTVNGRILKKGIDYLLHYTDNVERGVATAIFTGIGNYTGTITHLFFIVQTSIDCAVIRDIPDQAYTGKAIKPEPTVTVDGRILKEGIDYILYYADNIERGVATVFVRGINEHHGTTMATFYIAPASIAKAKVSAIAAKAYTGKAIKPKPKVTLGGRRLKLGRDYTLSYVKNTKSGTATVTVKGKGNYKGTKSAKFKIVQPIVSYRVRVQGVGNLTAVRNGRLAGTTGQSRRLEAIWMSLGKGFPVSGGIRYKSHVQGSGWEKDWAKGGVRSGTTGKSKRLEAVRIELTGQMAKRYDVYYRVHAKNLGWMGWAKNGAKAGTTGQSRRLEAIQVVLVPKGRKAPGATYKGARQTFGKAFAS